LTLPRPPGRWILTGLAALFAISAVAWLVLPGGSLAEGARSAGPGLSDASVPGATMGLDAVTTWEPTTPDPDVAGSGAQPTGSSGIDAVGVSIPSIEVDSPLIPLEVDPASRVLVPPDRYDVAGVFTSGPVPGEVGPAIIAGHVDSRAGPGVFYRLEEMLPGALIQVSLSDGELIDFQVARVAQYPKSAFPTDMVYGPTPDRELRLITCGGHFDPTRRSYLDNIVGYAVRI